MFQTQTVMALFALPDDGPAAHQLLLDQIGSARVSVRLFMYQFSELPFVDALAAAHERGVDVRLLLDHLQSTTPTEVAALHRLLLRLPAQRVCICTSTQHQINHRKVLIIDGLADVPDAQYPNLETATAAGYPRSFTGSTNWSGTAFRQTNDLLALPGKLLAAEYHREFDALWTWAMGHEAGYQLNPGGNAAGGIG